MRRTVIRLRHLVILSMAWMLMRKGLNRKRKRRSKFPMVESTFRTAFASMRIFNRTYIGMVIDLFCSQLPMFPNLMMVHDCKPCRQKTRWRSLWQTLCPSPGNSDLWFVSWRNPIPPPLSDSDLAEMVTISSSWIYTLKSQPFHIFMSCLAEHPPMQGASKTSKHRLRRWMCNMIWPMMLGRRERWRIFPPSRFLVSNYFCRTRPMW